MQITGTGLSDTGKERDNNEDSFLVDNELGIYLVSDGMGGHQAGEVASQMAVDIFRGWFEERQGWLSELALEPSRITELLPVVTQAVGAACKAIFDEGQQNRDRAKMGATFTGVVVVGRKAIMAHVGDSRLYLIRQGDTHQLSADHTMISMLLKAGVLTPEKARKSPHQHILARSVGSEPVTQVDTLIIDLMPGDHLLLCSDGLSNYLSEDASDLEVIFEEDDLDNIPETLINFANTSGGRDNITAVVVRAEDDDQRDARAARVMKRRLDALSQTILARGMSLASQLRLLSACQPLRLKGGETLIEAGERIDRIWIVIEGALEASGPFDQSKIIERGAVLGAGGLVSPRMSRATISAVDDTRLLILERSRFVKLIKSKPWMGLALFHNLSGHLSQALLDTSSVERLV